VRKPSLPAAVSGETSRSEKDSRDSEAANLRTDLTFSSDVSPVTGGSSAFLIVPPDLSAGELQLYIQQIINKSLRNQLYSAEKSNFRLLLLRGCLILFGSASGYPYFSIAKKAGRGNEDLGLAFAIATLISFGGSTSWVVNEVIDRHMPLTIEQKKIFNVRAHLLRIVICDALSLFGGMPFAYAAYTFNSNSVALGVMAYLVAFFYGSVGFYQLFSDDSSFMKLIARCFYSKEKIEAQESKARLITLIQYLTSNYQEHPSKFQKFYSEASAASPQEQNALLIAEVERVNTERNLSILPEEWCSGYPRAALTIIFYLFPMTNSVTEFTLAWDNATSWVNNPVFGAMLMIMSAAPDLALNLYSAKVLAQNIFDMIFYRKKIFKHTPCGRLFLLSMLGILGLSISALASNANAYITSKVLGKKGFSEWVKLFAVATWATNTIFQTFAINDLCQKLVNYFQSKNDGVFCFRNGLNSLSTVITNSTVSTYNCFIQTAAPNLFSVKNSYSEDGISRVGNNSDFDRCKPAGNTI